jgi:nucleoside-diphosphate-sugar epimerase
MTATTAPKSSSRIALVLGITGGYGRALASELLEHGWTVRALVRDPARATEVVADLPGPVELLTGDVLDEAALRGALSGASVLVHGVNAPYPKWDPLVLRFAQAIADAAAAAGATILFPGNVYNFAPGLDLDEATPEAPPTHKGELRVAVERILGDAVERGARLITLRGGDFYGLGTASSWMSFLAGKAATGGAFTLPAAPEVRHQWAYLPDFARAHVALLERADALPPAAVFHFEGHVITGDDLVDAARIALDRPAMKARPLPWTMLRLGGLFVPMLRELVRMRYLWDEELVMDGAALRRTLGEVEHTPLIDALRAEFAALGAPAAA